MTRHRVTAFQGPAIRVSSSMVLPDSAGPSVRMTRRVFSTHSGYRAVSPTATHTSDIGADTTADATTAVSLTMPPPLVRGPVPSGLLRGTGPRADAARPSVPRDLAPGPTSGDPAITRPKTTPLAVLSRFLGAVGSALTSRREHGLDEGAAAVADRPPHPPH